MTTESDIQKLATALAGSDPNKVGTSKALIISMEDGPPPSCTINLSGDSVLIPGVQFLDSYTPRIGDTVNLLKQNGSLLIIGSVATGANNIGWITPSLNSDFTHNANANGNLMYRRIIRNGLWALEFIGAANCNNGAGTIFTLPTGYRPSTKRTLAVGRNFHYYASTMLCDIATNGDVQVFNNGGGETTLNSGTGHTHGLSSLDEPISAIFNNIMVYL